MSKLKSLQYKTRGRKYKYRVYKTYKNGRHVLVYQSDSLMNARERAGKLMEKARVASVSIVDDWGHNVSI